MEPAYPVPLEGQMPNLRGKLEPVPQPQPSKQEVVNQIRNRDNVVVYRSFRSEWRLIVLLLFTGILANMATYTFPATTLSFSIGEFRGIRFGLLLPILSLLPLGLFLLTIKRVFDERYIIGMQSIIRVTGMLSFSTATTEIYYANVRAVEIEQSFFQRLLNIGNIRIGALFSATGDITMRGVRNPEQCKSILERRLRSV